jgi:hypothetical protein
MDYRYKNGRVDWFKLVRNIDQKWYVGNTMTDLRFNQMRELSWPGCQPLASQGGLYTMELFMHVLNQGIKWNCCGEMCILSSCLNSRIDDFVQMTLLIVFMYFGFLLRNNKYNKTEDL